MKKYGKYTLVGWSWRTLMWVVLTPILLFLLLFVIIYIPPVQKWAVDKAAEVLSEEMGMEVTIEDICLKFPLDLSMGGMTAVQDGDTLIHAGTLDISIKALPLFEGKAEVDGVTLKDTRLNTKGMIEACAITGHVGEISLDSHSTDFLEEFAVVNKALICDADLFIELKDSVPEDTTTSEPILWKVQLDDAVLRNVKATVLLTPNADSTYVMANIGNGHAKAFLDLGAEVYKVDELHIEESAASFEIRSEKRLPDQLDPAHMLFDNMTLDIDSLCYKGTGDMVLNIKQLAAREQSGLNITETKGRVEMDSVSLFVPKLTVKTDDSNLALSYRMDMNAFEDTNPGTFTAVAEGQIGKGDIIYFTKMGGEDTKDVRSMMSQTLPAQPVQVAMKASGNLEELNIKDMRIKVPGMVIVDANATLWDVVNDLALKADADARFGKTSSVSIDGSYVMASEAYRADIDFSNILVNQFVAMEDQCMLSGKASASGKGFDFFAPTTTLDADISLGNANYGKINLSNIDASASLTGRKLSLDLGCDNNQLQTDFILDGELQKNLVSGVLNINLPFADIQGMGFSEDRLQVSTAGVFDFSYNLDKLFRVDSHVDALQLHMGKDSIMTDHFDLYAEAKQDSTAATLNTGDLSFEFFSPNNLFKLQPRFEKLASVASNQAKKRAIDISILKQYFPDICMHATAGNNNPVSQILAIYGIKFKEFFADIDASPAEGISGNGHVYAFKMDSILVDTVFFDIAQDSSNLVVHTGVTCHEQAQLPAFRAYMDGVLGMKDADLHLTYFNKFNEKGIDLGLRATGTDSCHHVKLYPEQPIIAYKKFALNDDNFVCLRRDGSPIIADVKLKSLEDSCFVSLTAEENKFGEQSACAIIQNLDISDVLSVVPIPGLPKMDGLLNIDADYDVEQNMFTVSGTTGVDDFMYEGMKVGDLGATFHYVPEGETAHNFGMSMKYNSTEILDLQGRYDAKDKGALIAEANLKDIPMSMISPFIPDQIVAFSGHLAGNAYVEGPTDALLFTGELRPKNVHAIANSYSLDLGLANDTIRFKDSHLTFEQFKIYGADDNPLALNGYVDFANFKNINMALSLYGNNFKLVEAKRTAKKVLYGDMYGDFFARVNGSLKDLSVRGLVRVLKSTDMTYIMTETPISQGDRLDDIVTFIDFKAPIESSGEEEKKTFMGIDMNMSLEVENGAHLRAEISADKQSYVNVQGGGTIRMTLSPQGVLNMQGRYTINEGEMKYTLPIIPLKTFRIHNGSYIEFTGDPANPILNIAATERTRATVADGTGASRSVTFDAGLKITNTLSNMGLEFTIEAPEDLTVQSELAAMGPEERNKLAVAMLATSMYLSSANSKGFTAGNALNSFLQNEINNIAGKAFSTLVNVDVGMEQTTRDNGTTRTDYSFKFSRRFFSDRLNVVIGGKVSADGDKERNESGTYIDDISLEWRLDDGGTQYVRVFHEKDFSNLVEGELDKNGGGVLLRKKVDKFSDLFIWKKKKDEKGDTNRNSEQKDKKENKKDKKRQNEEGGKKD
ncbi:MAG: translocation/assembly module TamB domain-containing protein [Prevotellaceae bacterium]|nr:translocation/assembly module TamB domain-containing protein [Candidatus Minthosoma caballi]